MCNSSVLFVLLVCFVFCGFTESKPLEPTSRTSQQWNQELLTMGREKYESYLALTLAAASSGKSFFEQPEPLTEDCIRSAKVAMNLLTKSSTMAETQQFLVKCFQQTNVTSSQNPAEILCKNMYDEVKLGDSYFPDLNARYMALEEFEAAEEAKVSNATSTASPREYSSTSSGREEVNSSTLCPPGILFCPLQYFEMLKKKVELLRPTKNYIAAIPQQTTVAEFFKKPLDVDNDPQVIQLEMMVRFFNVEHRVTWKTIIALTWDEPIQSTVDSVFVEARDNYLKDFLTKSANKNETQLHASNPNKHRDFAKMVDEYFSKNPKLKDEYIKTKEGYEIIRKGEERKREDYRKFQEEYIKQIQNYTILQETNKELQKMYEKHQEINKKLQEEYDKHQEVREMLQKEYEKKEEEYKKAPVEDKKVQEEYEKLQQTHKKEVEEMKKLGEAFKKSQEDVAKLLETCKKGRETIKKLLGECEEKLAAHSFLLGLMKIPGKDEREMPDVFKILQEE